MTELNIYQRVNAVQKEVSYVQKDKQVSGGGTNYKAVTHDQVVSVIRESLVKAGIVVYPEQLGHSMPILRDIKSDVKMHLYDGDYAIHFVNIDKPDDRITVTINAQANDNGDKAPGKAVTYATKAAMLKVFNLETGEDEESRAEQRNIDYITAEQAAKVWPYLVDDKGYWTPLGSKCSVAFGFKTVYEMKSKHFNKVLEQCKSSKA